MVRIHALSDTRIGEECITAIREDMNRLRGQLFGTIESWGMTDKRERACKGLVRHLTYDIQANLESIIRGEDD